MNIDLLRRPAQPVDVVPHLAQCVLDEMAPLTIKQWNWLLERAKVMPRATLRLVGEELMGQRRYRAHLRKLMPMPSAQFKKHGHRWAVPYADPAGGFGHGYGRTLREALWHARKAREKAWGASDRPAGDWWLEMFKRSMTEPQLREFNDRIAEATRRALVADAAEAAEVFGEDELERHAALKALDAEADRCYWASGDCLCPVCGAEYRTHPYTEHRSPESMGGEHYMRRLCNGDIVKL